MLSSLAIKFINAFVEVKQSFINLLNLLPLLLDLESLNQVLLPPQLLFPLLADLHGL